MEIIKDVASVIGCCVSAITLLGLIIKPIRKKISKWIRDISEASETSVSIKSINDKMDGLREKVDKIEETNTLLVERMDSLDERISKLDKRVFENERDRIKAELSEYASRCARGMKIYPEEKLHIDEIYSKYSNELHCNSTGSEYYHEIVKYYDNQNWLKA